MKLPDINSFENIVSLGFFCGVAETIQKVGLRKKSYPFDWVISNEFEKVVSLIENDFKGWLNLKFLYQSKDHREQYTNIEYNISFFHDFDKYTSLDQQISNVRKKYEKRINRFYEDIKKPTLFIRYLPSQSDFGYALKNNNKIQSLLKQYNKQNQILYIANNNLENTEGLDCIFLVSPDVDKTVCNDPISSNIELKNYFSSIENNKIDKTSIKKYRRIERKFTPIKVLFRKMKKILISLFKKEYIHGKTI